MMPPVGCVRCGQRQVDPDSGPSAWRRAVVGGEQVLVCPECQTEGWTTGLDACASCGSTVLVKRLGEVECRTCGRSWQPPSSSDVASEGADVDDRRAALSDDVASALDRVLGRS